MLAWSFGSLWDILAQMRRATVERMKYLFNPKPQSSTPGVFWRAVDLLNCIAVFILYFVAAIVGYPLLIVLMVLAQIPIEPVQNFIVLKLLRPLLLTTAGEFKLYMDDELQAGNVRRRIADAAQELMTRTGCRDLVVIAHSEGAVVSLGTLSDPIYSSIADRVKLITLGGGLNKSWLVRPNVDRMFRPLRTDVQWTDIWSSYARCRAGPLDPSPRKLPPGQNPVPDDRHLPAEWPAANPDQRAGHQRHGDPDRPRRLLRQRRASPDQAGGRDQRAELRRLGFWPLDQVTDPSQDSQAFLHRGCAASRACLALALWRDIAVAAWLAAAVVPWPAGWLVQCRAVGTVGEGIADGGPGRRLVSALVGLRAWLNTLPALFTPLASVPDSLLQMPAGARPGGYRRCRGRAVYRGVQVWWSRWGSPRPAKRSPPRPRSTATSG